MQSPVHLNWPSCNNKEISGLLCAVPGNAAACRAVLAKHFQRWSWSTWWEWMTMQTKAWAGMEARQRQAKHGMANTDQARCSTRGGWHMKLAGSVWSREVVEGVWWCRPVWKQAWTYPTVSPQPVAYACPCPYPPPLACNKQKKTKFRLFKLLLTRRPPVRSDWNLPGILLGPRGCAFSRFDINRTSGSQVTAIYLPTNHRTRCYDITYNVTILLLLRLIWRHNWRWGPEYVPFQGFILIG